MSSGSDESKGKTITKLAPIIGRWKIDDQRATCEGPEEQGPPYGLCVSDVRFLEGEVQVTVRRIGDAGVVDGRIVFGYRSLEHDYFTVGLHSEGRAYQIQHYSRALGAWYGLAVAGLASNLAGGSSFVIRVLVRGQRISLEVDGVRVIDYVLPMPLPYGQLVCTHGYAKAANSNSQISLQIQCEAMHL